jgi:hypothetical protein
MRIYPIGLDSETTDPPTDKERDQDDDDAPETPPDEPRPPGVQEPPQPDPKGPYVVTGMSF